MSRSELLRRAVARYQEDWEQEKEEKRLQAQRMAASKRIDEFREKYAHLVPPGWDSTRVIREWRDRDRLTRLREREERERPS